MAAKKGFQGFVNAMTFVERFQPWMKAFHDKRVVRGATETALDTPTPRPQALPPHRSQGTPRRTSKEATPVQTVRKPSPSPKQQTQTPSRPASPAKRCLTQFRDSLDSVPKCRKEERRAASIERETEELIRLRDSI